ncbi:MAG: SDR family oxidoreductase [Bacilli bacterium]|jgi:short-subunit dehydrogenase|nr:SDR family NAD(P)-dependent oxidoreductase [Bacilli bacterium]MDD3389660.1 SDR family NAD(P)-dependent oxidoreductase [Bacilli bacterium]MDD4345279.1 SDR family NAD(P)-dependent oxidoreductase [Bacilli bacterium]MDD4521332.1 SDR family NAD(P)-dependent oxidoreductase [Bacilli bacterium]MDY0400066.1 SDR family oxidoreductase [Bacilli bacterium]
MKANGKVIVVTGGGNGIGRAVVLNLLHRGAIVAAADISEAGLEETKKIARDFADKLSLHVVDLAKKEQVEKLLKDVQETHKAVDGFINVAGVIQPFIKVNDLSYEKIEWVMNINFYGTLYMVKSFLPALLKREEAHIVNVSSMGGFVPVPGQTIYGASKAAVKLLTEGLHSELQGTNVHVTVVFPGGVATDISKNSGADNRKQNSDDQSKKQSKMKLLTPEQCAEIIVRGMEKNKYRVVAGKDAKMLDKLSRMAPKKAANIIAKKLASILD